ncbi:hypothetical protein ACLK19_00395 [Escherichia coli]
MNIVRLADTIQTTNTLLQYIGLNGSRNITMWLANWKLRPSEPICQHSSTCAPVVLRRTRRQAVTFDNRHTFVEHRSANTFTFAQLLLQLQRSGSFGQITSTF